MKAVYLLIPLAVLFVLIMVGPVILVNVNLLPKELDWMCGPLRMIAAMVIMMVMIWIWSNLDPINHLFDRWFQRKKTP